MPLVTYLQGLPKARLCRVCGAEIKRKGQETCYFVIWVGMLSNQKIQKIRNIPFQGDKSTGENDQDTTPSLLR